MLARLGAASRRRRRSTTLSFPEGAFPSSVPTAETSTVEVPSAPSARVQSVSRPEDRGGHDFEAPKAPVDRALPSSRISRTSGPRRQCSTNMTIASLLYRLCGSRINRTRSSTRSGSRMLSPRREASFARSWATSPMTRGESPRSKRSRLTAPRPPAGCARSGPRGAAPSSIISTRSALAPSQARSSTRHSTSAQALAVWPVTRNVASKRTISRAHCAQRRALGALARADGSLATGDLTNATLKGPDAPSLSTSRHRDAAVLRRKRGVDFWSRADGEGALDTSRPARASALPREGRRRGGCRNRLVDLAATQPIRRNGAGASRVGARWSAARSRGANSDCAAVYLASRRARECLGRAPAALPRCARSSSFGELKTAGRCGRCSGVASRADRVLARGAALVQNDLREYDVQRS